jgi:malate permease and related proteins
MWEKGLGDEGEHCICQRRLFLNVSSEYSPVKRLDSNFIHLGIRLGQLYLLLIPGVLLGVLLGRRLPAHSATYLANALFWVGSPLTIVIFLRGANLAGWVWTAPFVAWAAMIAGVALGWIWISICGGRSLWSGATQGSFLLSAMAGNTGYLGYPIVLALVGQKYFAWALFYDLFGSALGTYGLGVSVAAYFGGHARTLGQWLKQMLKNPPLWGFLVGLWVRNFPLVPPVEQGLKAIAWGIVFISLVMIGMRLAQASLKQELAKLLPSLGIKMLLVPLILGFGLSRMGLNGAVLLILVLQMSMPPAISTLLLAEVYQLDRDLTVTALVLGVLLLLFLLPIWVVLYGVA